MRGFAPPVVLVALVALATSCGSSRRSALPVSRTAGAGETSTSTVSPDAPEPSLRYSVSVGRSGFEVSVTMEVARLAGTSFELPWSGSRALRDASMTSPVLRKLDGGAETWDIPECATACVVTYRVDASSFRRRRFSDEGIATDGAVMTTVRMFLARPVSFHGTVEVALPESTRFASGLLGGRFEAEAWDESTFAMIGDGACAPLPDRPTRLCVLGKMSMAPPALAAAVGRAERGVANFYGRFPAPELTMFASTVPRSSEIVFGKVRAAAGPSIAFFVGERFDSPKRDWVMVHELLHLGFPTLFEARWFSEGIATVFEPLVRLRLGDLDEKTVWKGFVDNLPRGLEASRKAGAIAEQGDIDAMYWGSSVFLFEWEHALRAATDGRVGVENALARFAQSHKSAPVIRIAELSAVAREIDRLTETTALQTRLASLSHDRTVTLAGLLAPFGLDERGRVVDDSEGARARRRRFLHNPP